ncbi:hypothetical protein FN846DRAFT_1004346 [Sphaerosporella brunnea]|uniref:Uncharacterized protein n=1 Tax=Sphaerosporella brunnea TaxID=1250544 RepID=A0A5J5EEH0_9PEZI|nr:hypothetical protein FN846DRAFT_1004346 [Sphaerosporella brunnea]
MSQAPGTAIPDPLTVAGWTRDDVMAYLQPNIKYWTETDRKIFTEANVFGESFLYLADPKYEDREDFKALNMSFGAYRSVINAATTIVRAAAKKRNIELTETGEGPEPLKRRLEAHEPKAQDSDLQTARTLHSILWRKGNSTRNKIFQERIVSVPTFGERETTTAATFLHLDLQNLVTEYFQNSMEESPTVIGQCVLPCNTNTMLVREAYQEAYAYVSKRDRNREKARGVQIYHNEDGTRTARYEELENSRLPTDRAIIFTGHPGIGKTWFLSYILVERLLKGLPTIVQYASNEPDGSIPCLILFDECAPRILDTFHPDIANNSDIWVLCDRKALGLSIQTHKHAWYLVIATSPKPSNVKTVKKHHQAPSLYMPLWGWEELVGTQRFVDREQLRKMHELVLMFGEVPRLILNQLMSRPGAGSEATVANNLSTNEELHTLERRVRAELSIIESKMIDLLRDGFLAFADRQFGTADSHSLARIDPIVEAPYKYISIEANLSVMTAYLGRLIGMNSVVRANLEAKALYDAMLSSAQMRSAMGWVFEGRVHWLLHDGATLLCRDMEKNGILTIKIKKGNQTFSSLRQRFG